MKTSRLAVEQIDRNLAEVAKIADRARAPLAGWVCTIRQALGMPARYLAHKLNVVQSSVTRAEASEAKGTITLNQLRIMANALDCELVYALVPRQSLAITLSSRADQIAAEQERYVENTMALEGQFTSEEFRAEMRVRRKEQLLSGTWRRLWSAGPY